MSDDLLNFDDIPSNFYRPSENTSKAESLIDLTEPVTQMLASSENLLTLDGSIEAANPNPNPFEKMPSLKISGNEGSISFKQPEIMPKIDIIIDPFTSGPSEISPSKNSNLPPPLIPSPLNPVSATSLETTEVSNLSATEQVSLSSPEVASPTNTVPSRLASPANNTIPKGPVSRLNPIPPVILPSHLSLPTRRWTDPTVFCSIPLTDELGDTIKKCFSHLPVNQRPQRNQISIAQAIESSSDAFISLINSNRYAIFFEKFD